MFCIVEDYKILNSCYILYFGSVAIRQRLNMIFSVRLQERMIWWLFKAV